MTGWAAWQPWLIGGLAASLLLWYVVRSLFADRARGRRRCLRCGQEFAPEQGLTCTECGWTARHERDLLRTRRHWGKAVLGLLVLLGSAVIVRIMSEGGNPLVVVPDRPLVWMLKLDPAGVSGRGPVSAELQRRLLRRDRAGDPTEPLVARLVDAITVGGPGARPGSEDWRLRYGGIASDVRNGFVDAESPLGVRLASLPPVIRIDLPTAWPSDEAIPARLDLSEWWPIGTEAILECRWKDRPEEPAWMTVGFRNLASIERRHQFMLPPAESWPESGEVVVSCRTRSMPPRWNALRESGLPLVEETEVDASGPPRAALDGVVVLTAPTPATLELEPWPGDPAADARVAAVFDAGLRHWPGTPRPFAIRFDLRPLSHESLEGVLFGLVVEIIEQPTEGPEVVHRRTRIWSPGSASNQLAGTGRGRAAGWTISEESIDGLARAFDPENDSTWIMRIRGDEGLARRGLSSLSVAGSDAMPARWWSGSVDRPLARQTVSNGRAFLRMWFDPEGVKAPSPAQAPTPASTD